MDLLFNVLLSIYVKQGGITNIIIQDMGDWYYIKQIVTAFYFCKKIIEEVENIIF